MFLWHLYEKPTFNQEISTKSFYETHKPTETSTKFSNFCVFSFFPSFMFMSFSFAHLEIVGFSIDLLLSKTDSITLWQRVGLKY